MKKNLVFKTVALAAMVVGGVSIATAVAARVRRTKDEEDTANAIIEADMIAENFSGMRGERPRWINRPSTPTSTSRRVRRARRGGRKIGTKCPEGFTFVYGSGCIPASAARSIVGKPCKGGRGVWAGGVPCHDPSGNPTGENNCVTCYTGGASTATN